MSGAVTGHLETERKYDAGPDFVMPDLSVVPSVVSVTGPELYQLSAIYFDTEDFRLMAHRVTLRRRAGGSDEGWHLKLPVRPGTRPGRPACGLARGAVGRRQQLARAGSRHGRLLRAERAYQRAAGGSRP